MKKYSIKTPEICEMLGVSRQTLFTWEKKGYLTSPRIGMRGDRAFTPEQAEQVVKAFSPGGKKQWHFT